MIDQELLDILACPACKGDVILEENKIVCKKCGKRYPIKDGIPVMLIDTCQGAQKAPLSVNHKRGRRVDQAGD